VILKNIDKLHSRYPISRLLGFVKLSIVGVGISTHSGIAAKVLTTLSDHNIRYYQITSSEISISLTIEEKDKLKAVEVLGKAFDL
jgi:aspartate kinase